MKEFWNTIQFIFTAIGGWLGYFLGGCDGLLYTLLAFVVLDYLTGVMCAITDHKSLLTLALRASSGKCSSSHWSASAICWTCRYSEVSVSSVPL